MDEGEAEEEAHAVHKPERMYVQFLHLNGFFLIFYNYWYF